MEILKANPLNALFELYFIWLMDSIWCIVIASVVWICIFAALYMNYIQPACAAESQCKNFGCIEWIHHSAATFFALQQGIAGDPKIIITPRENNQQLQLKEVLALENETAYWVFWQFTILEMVVGVLHLGIMISYLFQKISR
jgi:hypothetical protein